MSNPFVEERTCTTCMQHDKRRSRATHIATALSGLQWFACADCARDLTTNCGAVPARMQPIDEWAAAHGMTMFDQRATLQRELAASAAQMDAAQAILEEA